MTKIRKHTIELHSPKTEAAAEAAEHFAYLTEQGARRKKDAIEGNLSAADLAAHTDELNLARLRADVTREAADAEMASLSDDNSVTDAIAELLDDSALSTAALEEAVANVQSALAALEASNQERNAAIIAWVNRLRELGVPDTGLTVNDDEIRIQSSGITGTQIMVGAGSVATIGSTAEYVKHVTRGHADRARMAIDPINITRADTRGRTRGAVTSVRLLTALGGNKAGTVLTTRTHTLGVLAQMVHVGNAELIEGELPEPSTRERSFMFVDNRTKGPQEATTISNANDEAIIEAAVAKAFTN